MCDCIVPEIQEKFAVRKLMSLYLTAIECSTVTYGYEYHKMVRIFSRKFSKEEKSPHFFLDPNIKW